MCPCPLGQEPFYRDLWLPFYFYRGPISPRTESHMKEKRDSGAQLLDYEDTNCFYRSQRKREADR